MSVTDLLFEAKLLLTRAMLVVEKPLATRVEEAEKIVEAAESRGVPVAVNYSRRFAKSHARLLDMIKKGDLGRILHVSGLYSKGLLHTGTHWLDLAMYFFGDIRKSMGHYSGQQNGDDPELDFYLEFDSGATGFVKGCPAEAYSVFEMDVIGTGGRLRILDSGCRFELFQKEMDPRSNAGWILAKVCDEEIGFEDFLLDLVQNVVQTLREWETLRCDARHAVEVLRLAQSIRESAVREEFFRDGSRP